MRPLGAVGAAHPHTISAGADSSRTKEIPSEASAEAGRPSTGLVLFFWASVSELH